MRIGIAIFLFSSICNAKTIRIAVIDTGFDRSLSTARFCRDANPFNDSSPYKHGTNVADLIAQNAKGDYCLYPFSIFTPNFNLGGYLAVLELLTHMDIDILNLSLQGAQYYPEEARLIKKLLNKGVTIFAAAGNRNQILNDDICETYPACIDKRIVVVGSYAANSGRGSRVKIKTNRDAGCVKDYCLKGTSQATAIESGRFAAYLYDHLKVH